jgi:hypothetical protein
MKLTKIVFMALALIAVQANADVKSKKMHAGVDYASPGGYQGLVKNANMVNGEYIDIHFTPFALGSDRWNLVPPVIAGSELHLRVACFDTPTMTCAMTYQTLTDATNTSLPVNFVIERNAGVTFISEFVPNAAA